MSKKITRHPSNSSTPGPSNPLFSPAVLFKSARADTSTNPAHSSMVLGVPGGLFPDVSPIGGGCSEVQLCTGPGGVTRASQTPTGEVEEGGSGHDGGLLSLVDSGVKEDHHHHQMEPQFPSTHSKDVHMQVSTELKDNYKLLDYSCTDRHNNNQVSNPLRTPTT